MNKILCVVLAITMLAGANAACAAAADGCKTCNTGLTACTACEAGYLLPSATSETCTQCPINTYAADGNAATTCTKCTAGHYAPAGSDAVGDCSAAVCTPNCDACADASTCADCSNGYLLGTDDLCTATCVANCADCASATVCTTCATGYTANEAKTECVFGSRIAASMLFIAAAIFATMF